MLYLLFLHFVADFPLQSHYIACNKSKNIFVLLLHILIYSFVMGLFTLNPYFFIWMFTTHFLIDFATSKYTSYLWKTERYKWFFNVIGFDQFLHFCTIWLFIEYRGI